MPSSRPRAAAVLPDPIRSEPPRLPLSRASKLPRILAGLLLLVALIAGLIVALRGELRARVSFEDATPLLVVSVPRADEGEVIEVLGQSATVHAGEARVRLARDTLVVGANELGVTRDGEITSVSVNVPHLVLRDEQAIAGSPPRVGLVLRAAPGTSASVDGAPVSIDAHGEGHWSIPSASDASVYDRQLVVHFASAPEEDLRVHLRVEPASLVVDQPTPSFVTDRASLELEARVAESARVELDGEPVVSEGGVARATLAFPREGDFRFRLDVSDAGKRRRSETILVRRVADLRAASAAFVADPGLSVDALVREPEAHAGASVALTGRVVAVNVEGGRSFVDVDAAPCAGACRLRVEYSAPTNAHLGDSVRVLGRFVHLAASQGAPASSRVDAAFLLVGPP